MDSAVKPQNDKNN